MPIGSSGPDGRWAATRIDPPCFAGVLAPALPPAEGAAPLAPGLVVVPPHAAITALIEAMDRPTTVPRLMNSRRDSRPRANDSTASSCSGVVVRRTLSSSE